jgi:hypothetical protein
MDIERLMDLVKWYGDARAEWANPQVIRRDRRAETLDAVRLAVNELTTLAPGDTEASAGVPVLPEDPTSDHDALIDRMRTGCWYDTGLCACPAAPFNYSGCRAPRKQVGHAG